MRLTIQFWMILTTVTFIQIWMINVIQFWMFIVSFCPSIEKSFKKHPFLDDFDAISQIIKKWMIVGRQ